MFCLQNIFQHFNIGKFYMTSLVSGYEFYKLCKWNYCARYPINWIPEKVQENDFVFLNIDNFFMFLNTLKPGMPKFNIITHNSDRSFTEHYAKELKGKVNKVYSQNCLLNSDEVFHQIPIGFVDVKNKHLHAKENDNTNFHDFLLQIENKNLDKRILCYINFKLENNPSARMPCLNHFNGKTWAYIKSNVETHKFYEQISMSKYIPCPAGSGIDTHRVYESILLNSIPIVVSSPLNELYRKLPVLIVDSWNNITQEFLESSYDYQYKYLTNWKKNNPDWLKADYWI